MDKTDILQTINNSLAAITEEPFCFSVTHEVKGVKTPFVIKIHPTVPGVFFKINSILNTMPAMGELAPFSDKAFCDEHVKIVEENKDKVLKIICLAWWNKKGEYPKWYEDVMLYGVEKVSDWLIILYNVVIRLGAAPFLSATIAAAAMGLYGEIREAEKPKINTSIPQCC
jgi:hypothetical protein